MASTLAEIPLGRTVRVRSIAGPRAFRRRLLEMGLVPGTTVRVVTIAPLGDPLRIEVRHGQWSIRRAEAAQIEIEPLEVSAAAMTVDAIAAPANASTPPRVEASGPGSAVAAPTKRAE
jgi:ferrous iron transport protein A